MFREDQSSDLRVDFDFWLCHELISTCLVIKCYTIMYLFLEKE